MQTPITQLQDDLQDQSGELSPEFLEILQTEATTVQRDIETGIRPAVAHARAMLWLDALTKLHAAALEEAISEQNAEQSAVWSRDLAALEYALGMCLNIQPLTADREIKEG